MLEERELLVETEPAKLVQLLVAEDRGLGVQLPVDAPLHVVLTAQSPKHVGLGRQRRWGGLYLWLSMLVQLLLMLLMLLLLRWRLRDRRVLEVRELLVETELPELSQLVVTEQRSLRVQPPMHASRHVRVPAQASEHAAGGRLFLHLHGARGGDRRRDRNDLQLLHDGELVVEVELSEVKQLLVIQEACLGVELPVDALLQVGVPTRGAEQIVLGRRFHCWRVLEEGELLVET
mmetsp:Transcript_69294/g.206328  ORF Transcript_69294/g.206328 Transcript_69294/m.206328 type:complete len:233 (+) Transcript_69294:448-1146(+)